MGQTYEVDAATGNEKVTGTLTVTGMINANGGVTGTLTGSAATLANTAAAGNSAIMAINSGDTGTVPLTMGGTGSNLSATGGANQFVKQSTPGGALTVGTIADADVPNTITLDNITQITNRAISDTSGTLAVGRGGTGATTLTGILHGTGTNALTASPVALASGDVSGILPLANGGCGVSLAATGGVGQFVRQNSVGGVLTVSAITDADVPDTITLANLTQVTNRAISDTTGTLAVNRGGTGVTTLTGVVHGTGAGALTAGAVALGSEVSGTLPILNGGTGATAATGALNNLLPAQAGQAGKYIQTDGSGVVSWQAPSPATPIRWIAQGESMVVNKVVQTMVDKSCTVSEILMRSDVPPVGANLQIDIRRNGASIFTVMPAIGAGATTKTVAEVFNGTNTLAKGDVLTLDIKTVGSTTAGGDDLLITVILA